MCSLCFTEKKMEYEWSLLRGVYGLRLDKGEQEGRPGQRECSQITLAPLQIPLGFEDEPSGILRTGWGRQVQAKGAASQ